MTTNEIYVAAHVVGAVSWVGGATLAQLIEWRLHVSGDEAENRGYMNAMDFLGLRFFMPMALVTIIFGVLAVTSGYAEFSDPFVSIGLGVFTVSFITGMAYFAPQTAKLKADYEAGRFGDPEVTARERRMHRVGWFELTLLWITVIAMVVKP